MALISAKRQARSGDSIVAMTSPACHLSGISGLDSEL